MDTISIIVPIFHGRKYIDNMITQLEKCAVQSNSRYVLELLLVNDDPAEQIGRFSSEQINIKVLETDRNRGIHASRARGLEHSNGDFILFLDQDDEIYPNYFNSQLAHLNDKDAVVCKLLHEGRQYYDNRMPFEKVISREYIVGSKNPIISPGQVLLKKDAIPSSWINLTLQSNGADDWLLWLCMIAEEREFALNPELLFVHVVEGENESANVQHMIDSERELYETVKANGILRGQELKKLYGAVSSVETEHIGMLVKFRKMFFVYDLWLQLLEQGVSISAYLQQRNMHSIAIYGYNQIGKRLYRVLVKEGICVKYFVDMNAEYLNAEIPVYLPDDFLPEVDIVIISLVEAVEDIKERLSCLLETEIYGMQELFEEMKVFAGLNPAGEDGGI